MKRLLKAVMACLLVVTLCACTKNASSDTITATSYAKVSTFDWGCATSSVVLETDYLLDAVDYTYFTVTETKMATDFKDASYPVKKVTSERTIQDAYFIDANGEQVSKPTKQIKIVLQVGPDEGSPLLYSMKTMKNTWSDPYILHVELAKDATVTCQGTEVKKFTIADPELKTSVDKYETDTFTAKDGVKYNYVHYDMPKSKALVVWLHGMGEGGTKNTDVRIPLLACKTSNLLKKTFQKTVANSSILIPQCPTYWMDKDGKESNFNKGNIKSDGTSYYTKSLYELIMDYKEKVGAEKVVLAGASNGGYMVLNMAINYPKDWAGIVPICEAMEDKDITDKQIESIKNIPMYFIYSNNDPVVDPKTHEIPTIKRLRKANAKEVYVCTFNKIIDTTGDITTNDGKAYEFNGHWSWIRFLKNDCESDDESNTMSWKWVKLKLGHKKEDKAEVVEEDDDEDDDV